MSDAMWEDDRLTARSRGASVGDTGAMARRPSIVPSSGASGGAGPLPEKTPITISDEPAAGGAGGGGTIPGDDFDDLEAEMHGEPAAEGGSMLMGDPEAGRTGLWADGAPPAYGAAPELPPAYSEQDPHPPQPERVPWWKRARRSFGKGLRKVAGFLGLGGLFGRR